MAVQSIVEWIWPTKWRARNAARLFAIIPAACAMTSLANGLPNDSEPVQAADAIKSKKPDPQNGRVIVRALCTNCHLIGEAPNSAVNADVPSFPAVANKPDQSAEHISNWLLNSHGPMPNVHLTKKELSDVAAYIMSLRRPKS